MKQIVWPALNLNAGGRVSSISKAFSDSHLRCSSSTDWIALGLSDVFDAAFFFKGLVSHADNFPARDIPGLPSPVKIQPAQPYNVYIRIYRVKTLMSV